MSEPDADRVAALLALRAKYLEACALREERERLEATGARRFEGQALADRSARGRALARRFPGVLRELDVCDARTLRGRLHDVEAELVAARAGQPPQRLWIAAVLDFHHVWQAVLAERRAGRRSGAAAGTPASRRVWEEVARRRGLTVAEVRALVFPGA